MTQEMMYVDEAGGIYFDCRNHAGKREVCVIASTLCNVLIVACEKYGIKPKTEEDGHMTFDIAKAPKSLTETFRAVQEVFDDAAKQFPDHLVVY